MANGTRTYSFTMADVTVPVHAQTQTGFTVTVDNTVQTVSEASTDYYHFLADSGQAVHFAGTVGATDGSDAYLVDVHIFPNCVTPGALVPLG